MADAIRGLSSVAAGVALGSVALWLAVRGADLAAVPASLARIDSRLATAALATTLLSLGAVTWRWRLLFHPDHRARSFHALFRAVVVGQMVNIVLPIRMGEVARVFMAARSEGLGTMRVVATLALEKTLELAAFAAAAGVVVVLVALPGQAEVRPAALWVAGGGGLLMLWLAARYGRAVARAVIQDVLQLPPWMKRGLDRHSAGFIGGLSSLRSPHVVIAAVLSSGGIVMLASLSNYLLFLAFDLPLTWLAALVLLLLLQVGQVPPSLPGKIGVFNYLVVVGLGMFGVDRTAALSYSIALYAIGLLPKVVLGAVYLATDRGGFRLREIDFVRKRPVA